MTLAVSAPSAFEFAAPSPRELPLQGPSLQAPSRRQDVGLVEIGDRAIGLAVRERAGVRFFAAIPALGSLDARLFPSLKALRQAARAAGRRPEPRAGKAYTATSALMTACGS